ncbi:MAG: hypothetical protein JWR11_4314 [Mycobacterium sp.]|nr:hypothetical protein [Mycobacterium sp.]
MQPGPSNRPGAAGPPNYRHGSPVGNGIDATVPVRWQCYRWTLASGKYWKFPHGGATNPVHPGGSAVTVTTCQQVVRVTDTGSAGRTLAVMWPSVSGHHAVYTNPTSVSN